MAKTTEVKGLMKAFEQLRALNSLDFAMEEGVIHGFLDPSGSNKPMTIRCLLDLYHPDTGTIWVLDMDPSASAHNINRRVAYASGEVALWPNLTGQQALDALAAPRGRRDKTRERELIERFRLDSSKCIRAYLKGDRQKAILVTALSAPIDLFVLGKPTSRLDPLMEQTFGECIAQAKAEGRMVLLSSHTLGEVQTLCSHVTIIKDGAMVETGRLDRLRHLGTREIRVCGKESRLKSLFAGVESKGTAVVWDESDIVTEADTVRVPAVLGAAVTAGLVDITCMAANPEDLFLRHYETTVR